MDAVTAVLSIAAVQMKARHNNIMVCDREPFSAEYLRSLAQKTDDLKCVLLIQINCLESITQIIDAFICGSHKDRNCITDAIRIVFLPEIPPAGNIRIVQYIYADLRRLNRTGRLIQNILCCIKLPSILLCRFQILIIYFQIPVSFLRERFAQIIICLLKFIQANLQRISLVLNGVIHFSIPAINSGKIVKCMANDNRDHQHCPYQGKSNRFSVDDTVNLPSHNIPLT